MRRIMFVCHGNICRSPMAEIVFRDLIKKARLDGEFFVASSATSSEEIGYNGVGNPVYPPAREELLRHGLDPKDKRARKLKREDYDSYDYFVGMDSENIKNMNRIFGSDPCQKIRKLNKKDVFDPWYSGDFETAYDEIYTGCKELLNELIRESEV